MSKPRMSRGPGGQWYFSDGLTNFVSGLGTDRDKRSYTNFQYSTIDRLNLFELEAAYSTNWLARAVVDYQVDDATREWRSFSCKEATEIQRAEKRFQVQSHVQKGFKSSRLYGGAVIIPIIDGQDLTQPLDLDSIQQGSLRRFIVVDRRYIAGMEFEYNDPTSANFLMPRRYMIAGGSVQIHHSNVIRIPGEWIPMALRQANGGWDDSALRKCLEDIKDAVSAKAGIASLIQEANVDVITNNNFASEVATEEGAAITERYRLAALLKAINKMLILDGDETYERKAASFGGLGEILGSLMEWVSGAADYPMTRLFGVQSKGMGDTGGGDEKNYHNAIRGKQESDYRPVLERMDEIMIRSELGAMPEDCEFEFNPLAQPSGQEQAAAELAMSQADGNYISDGVVTTSVVARRLQAAGTYAITDEHIRQLEEDEKAQREGMFEGVAEEEDPDARPGETKQ